jgi:hypothetical protein
VALPFVIILYKSEFLCARFSSVMYITYVARNLFLFSLTFDGAEIKIKIYQKSVLMKYYVLSQLLQAQVLQTRSYEDSFAT